MIDVTAHYFAVFREQAGCELESLQTDAATAAALFGEVASRHKFLESTTRCKVAINGAMARWDASLTSGDQVLFFPPVAGG